MKALVIALVSIALTIATVVVGSALTFAYIKGIERQIEEADNTADSEEKIKIYEALLHKLGSGACILAFTLPHSEEGELGIIVCDALSALKSENEEDYLAAKNRLGHALGRTGRFVGFSLDSVF